MTKDIHDETRHNFPSDYTIKVIGKNSLSFEGEVIALIRKHFPNLGEGAVKHNKSKEKNYLALSITLYVESKQDLDNLYQALSDHPLVLFAL